MRIVQCIKKILAKEIPQNLSWQNLPNLSDTRRVSKHTENDKTQVIYLAYLPQKALIGKRSLADRSRASMGSGIWKYVENKEGLCMLLRAGRA